MTYESVYIDQNTVLNDFLTLLRESLGSQLNEVWLYGSRSRGDAAPDSDYDLIVVVDADPRKVDSVVSESAYRIMTEHSALVAPICYTPSVWQRVRNSPLGWNVLTEGTRLL